jgi:hypothetical protein
VAYQATRGKGIQRVVLEQYAEGVYVFVFKTAESRCPEEDYLQDDLAAAKEFCRERFEVVEKDWAVVADPGLAGGHAGPCSRK